MWRGGRNTEQEEIINGKVKKKIQVENETKKIGEKQ